MAQIQWYPGHMAKAKREVTEKLKLVDLILEIVDTRIPLSSRNPMLDDISAQKPRLIVLNKADLADPLATQRFETYFQAAGFHTLALDAQHHSKLPQISRITRQILSDKIEKQQSKGLKQVKLRLMCIGIPNVGKSTILNRLVQKNIAITGDRPGVTKNQQWLKVGSDLEVLDTPGILWPKFEDPEVGLKLALLGSIKDSLYAPDDVALFVLDYLRQFYPERLETTYHVDASDLKQDKAELMLQLTKKAGLKDDYDRFSKQLILDVRKGRFKRLTFDQVPQGVTAHE